MQMIRNSRTVLQVFYENRKFVGYVAVEEEKMIGCLFGHEKIWWNNSEVFIEEMFVTPKKQGAGIGTELLKTVEQYVTDNQLAGMTLSTNKYAPAPKFYEKNGFGHCKHVIFMAKEL